MKGLPLYTEGGLAALDRRTQNGLHGLICRLPWNLWRSLVKCNLQSKLDGGEGHLFNIRGTEDCVKPKPEKHYHLVSSEDESVLESDCGERKKGCKSATETKRSSSEFD